MRLAKEIKPPFLFLENVAAITCRGGLQVVKEIATLGYDCRWCVISAASVGALHRRERWFLLANAKSEGLQGQWRSAIGIKEKQPKPSMSSKDDCDTNSQPIYETYSKTLSFRDQRKAWRNNTTEYWPFKSRTHWQEVECQFWGIFNGIPHTMDTPKTGVTNAEEKRAQKDMSSMWANDEKKKVWETFRRFVEVQKKEILFHVLQFAESIKRSTNTISNWEANQMLQKEMLRTVQFFREFRNTSQGQKQVQQCNLKFNDAVLILSYFIASSNKRFECESWEIAMQILSEACEWTWVVRNAPCKIKETWESLSEKEKDWTIMASCFGRWWNEWPDVERAVDEKQSNRVDRLRSLGNAVVPIQVKQAFIELMGL